MARMRGLQWDMILVQELELREAILMVMHMVRILEGLMYVLLVVYQIGIFLVILGKIHWEGFWCR